MEIPPQQLKTMIQQWSAEFGFQGFGVSYCDLQPHEQALAQWTEAGLHGGMEDMTRHGTKRSRPAQLIPGTLTLLSFRMNYYPHSAADAWSVINDSQKGFVSRYALGRDYHKLMRNRLAQLAKRIETMVGPFGHRVFVDSAPVLERGIAENSGIGWIGKHTNLIHKQSGSWFFLGEIYTDLALLPDSPAINHCGHCSACIESCPTGAIIAPYKLDARRCISYLTIELAGPIPEEFREAIGNRVFGCDDCQLVCPWNRFTQSTTEVDFKVRHGLDAPQLLALFQWSETEFLKRMEGSPIRRIGHVRWLRNIALALGNATCNLADVQRGLEKQRNHPSEVVREQIEWSIDTLQKKHRIEINEKEL